MHYYQHNIKTFNSATGYLTRVERSLYRDLIELYYDKESAIDATDYDLLCRRISANSEEEKTALNFILNEFFEKDGNFYKHSYCDEIILKYQQDIEKKSKAGKASAKARKKRSKPNGEQVLNTCSTSEELTNNQEPITNNNKQIKTSDQRSLSVVKKIPKKSKNLVLKDFTDAGINQEIAEDFIQHRKNLKAPVTRTAMKAICTEANKANLPIETVLAEIQNRGWRGFKAEWLQENDRKCFAQINDEYQKEKAKERYATLLSATEEELSEWGLQ